MFIRNKLKTNNKISVQIVESVRKGDKVSQKIIMHIGLAQVGDDKLLEGLKLLAQDKMKQLEKEPQEEEELFDELEPKSTLGRKKRKQLADILPPDQVLLSDVREESRIIEGVDEIAGLAYEELGFDKLLLRGSNQLLRDVVLARLVFPESKHKLQQILAKQFDKEYSLSKIYRLMDQLYPKIERVKALVANKTQTLTPNADVVLFDVTTLHFETTNSDGLREFGYSKNFRVNTTQVVLALATNEHGLPLGYELFEGSMAEVKTLLKSLNNWKKMFNIKSVCFVADRAMFSKENLTMLDASGYEYVVAAKLRGLSQDRQKQILEGKHYNLEEVQNGAMWVGKFDYMVDLKDKFSTDSITFNTDEKEQLRNIYRVMLAQEDSFAQEYKDNLLVKLKRKEISLSSEFKEKLFSNSIFTAGSRSNRLIVTYRSERAKYDKQKRETALTKLSTKTGNIEKIINGGARKYLSVATVKYHFINNEQELNKFIVEVNDGDAIAFIVSLSKVFMSKPTKIKHIVILPEALYNDIPLLMPNLAVSYHEDLSKEIQVKMSKVAGIKAIKKNLNKILEGYLMNIVSYIDNKKVDDDAAWDGMHGVITNIKDKSANEIISKYRSLWHIEEAFRINKHNLKMRPVYHWSFKRIHTHIAICYMAFALLKLIQYKVALTQAKYSVINVIEAMLSVQSSIHVHKQTKDKYKLPGSMSHEASALYKAFRVHRNLDASVYL